ncbi:hypothetical protein [Pseudonocardia humida]|uniref:AAA domain-containing protein n=1 Tax=Pseudonocardia humida TaxID=2800819 RepID=A0ABT1A556_9PSEU|nr:hypothetical protein [Pseudonocardia humida]MCO1658125.1 hypothetical protein [Pseudonocardia humida]
MTDAIEVAGVNLAVLESWVSLEIQNEAGERMTARRAVVSADKDKSLIETTRTRSIAGDTGQKIRIRRDYFVGRSGGAQREAGFHFELARFVGWDLPRVARNDGSEGPLYLECLFPYFFVEQKRGWSGIQARIPNHYQIRDVGKRSAEFVLGLDSYKIVLQRQRLEAAASIISNEWRTIVAEIEAVARNSGAILRGSYSRPATTPSNVQAQAVVPSNQDWHSIDEEINRQEARLEELRTRPVSTVGENAAVLEADLEGVGDQYTTLTIALQQAVTAHEEAHARVASLDIRVAVLEEDLQRHKDAATLRRLGGENVEALTVDLTCPTCEQELPDGFDVTNSSMTEDENIAFIEQELKTYRAMRSDELRRRESEEVRLTRLRDEAAELRRRIRTVKDLLVAPSAMPSIEEATERVRIEDRLVALRSLRDQVTVATKNLQSRAEQLRKNRELLAELNRDLSQQDIGKLNYLQGALRQQLLSYGFSSLDPNSLEVSLDTYRPIHEGFDLGFDLSASDMVRVIWAYLLAILETGQRYETNHPSLLLFDEPRQQETSRFSFQALLSRAASDGNSGAQIIFATSEEEASLVAMLAGIRHRLISFPSRTKILLPVT